MNSTHKTVGMYLSQTRFYEESRVICKFVPSAKDSFLKTALSD